MAAVISPIAGTRTEPRDGYRFIRGTTVKFKQTFMQNGEPVNVDTATQPTARILEPMFLNKSGSTTPVILATINGTLVPGQQFEYEFEWDVPADLVPLDDYVITYSGTVGASTYQFGDEYFAIYVGAGQVGLKVFSYATVTDIRMQKFNIDDYLPETTRKDLNARNNIIEFHLQNATSRLREELNLHKSRSNTENYRLFCIYYTIWSILLASRGEDGSSVSDQNIAYWRGEWTRILDSIKRRSDFQGIAFGRG
jgi:hypothetical protein